MISLPNKRSNWLLPLEEEISSVKAEKERFIREKEELRGEKENLISEKERLISEKERLISEKEQLKNESKRLRIKRDSLRQRKMRLLAQKLSLKSKIAVDSTDYDNIEQGDIVVNLTMLEHELLTDIINHALDSVQFVAPYNSGLHDLPIENEIVQRVTTLENLRDRFVTLWAYRFHNNESNEIL